MSDEEELFDDAAAEDAEEDGEPEGLVEEAAAEDEEASALADSSEEEEEGQDEYEKDDFIVDEDDEADQPASEDEVTKSRKKKKKKKRDRELIPDEDDYALLEENDSSFKRPQRKRIKAREEKPQTREEMAAYFAEDKGTVDIEDDVEDLDEAGQGGEDEEAFEEDYEGDYEGGEMDDFIDDGDGQGRQRRPKRRIRTDGIAADALEEAADIFGNVDMLLQEYELKKAERRDGVQPTDQEQLEAEEEDYYGSDEELAMASQQRKEDAARQRRLKKALEVLDPEMVARKHLLPEDQSIAEKDLPERFQLLGKLIEEPLDYMAASKWIYDKLFSRDAPMRREKVILEDGWCEVNEDRPEGRHLLHAAPNLDLRGRRAVMVPRTHKQLQDWRDDDTAQQSVQDRISQVLKLLYDKHFEVPFIALYRKELCGELLSGREEDMPRVTEKADEGRGNRGISYPAGVVQAKHRRIRCWHVLWGVWEWSLKFKQLARRKDARRKVYEQALEKLVEAQYEEQVRAVEQCMDTLKEASSMEAVADVEQKFSLVMEALPGPEAQLMRLSLSENGRPTHKRPTKGSKYSVWKHLNLDKFLSQFVLSAEEFAECVEGAYKRHEPNDPRQDPITVAQDFVDDEVLKSPQEVLKASKLMAATELVAEPTVRNCMRELYERNAQVSSDPTATGDSSIDPIHKYGAVKRIRGKPVNEFHGDTFLRLICAEKENLIKVTMQVKADDMEEKVMEELKAFYLTNNVSKLAAEWNKLRQEVLFEAAHNRLFPVFEREFRSKLLMEAKENALHQYADKLWAIASHPPLYLRVYNADTKENISILPRIMAVVWGDGQPQPTTVVMLDVHGSLVDILHCHTMSGNIPRTGARNTSSDLFKDERKHKDAERLHTFIKKHKPNVVVVGCSAPQCRVLKSDIEFIRDFILAEEPWFISDYLENHNIDVRFVDESVSRLWEDCQSARDEFPEHNKHIRRGVALGRMHIDPLAVLSSLCDPKRAEILSLKLYVLQDQLSREDLLRKVEQVMVTAICQVGADLNLMAEMPWRAKTLQYLPGLGPRKAEPVLKHVQRALHRREEDDAEVGLSRGDFLVEGGVFQNQVTVYQNCAAFLRIRSTDMQNLVNVLFKPTDDSRIHPASLHSHAQTLAEAVDEEDADAAMRVPHKIEKLQHLPLADIVPHHYPDKMPTMIDIVFEFLMPFGEWRPDCLPLTEQQVFMLLHGETEDTLAVGKLVEAKVMRVFREEVRCVLTHSNAEAVIKRQNFSASADGRTLDMRSRVKPGDVVTARVLKLSDGSDDNDSERGMSQQNSYERRWVVSLTTRSDDLNNLEIWEEELKKRDKHYHILTLDEKMALQEIQDKARKSVKSKSFIERPIKHAFFHNISISEAVNKLGSDPPGSFLFRPNVRGLGSISLSICLHKGVQGQVFVHYDLKEAPRGHGGRAAQMRGLSTPLTVEIVGHGDESYEDLDEVCARFVDALMGFVRQLVEHRKFRDGSREELESALRSEKAALQRQGQAGAAYCLGVDYQKPGAFYIAFILNQTVHRDHFVVTPCGYYFRKRMFTHIDKVLNEFKRSPHNPHKEANLAEQQRYSGFSAYARQGPHPPGSSFGGKPGPGGYSSRGQSYVGYNPNQSQQPSLRQPYGHSRPSTSSYSQFSSQPPPPGVAPPPVG